jgi:hypothetical protein
VTKSPSISVAIAGLLSLSAVLPTFAADWKPVGERWPPFFIDMASIRKDHFSTQQGIGFTMQPYIVVWIKFVTTSSPMLHSRLVE